MLTKKFKKKKNLCEVTFATYAPSHVNGVSVCGDFNHWTPGKHAMARKEDGRFEITVALPVGLSYKFKYLRDDHAWVNDDNADSYFTHGDGNTDSVVDTTVPGEVDRRATSVPPVKPAAKKAAKKKASAKKKAAKKKAAKKKAD